MKRTLMVLSCVLAACEPIESETESEALGEAVQALCFGSSPPPGFTPSVERSLDGGPDAVRSDGFHTLDPCSFYSMGVDSSPDPAHNVEVEYHTDGACNDAEPSAQEAFVWKRSGVGVFAVWSRATIPMAGSSAGGSCKWRGSVSVDQQNYTRLIIAARGEQPDGSPVAPELRAFELEYTIPGFPPPKYAPPPVICAAPLAPPTSFDSSQSLDGATTLVTYSGLPTASCDFVSMTVDTNPDRAQVVQVNLTSSSIPSAVDVDSLEVYAWLVTSSFSGRQRLIPQQVNNIWTASLFLDANNNYTRVSVAARAVSDDGSPLDSIELTVMD